LGGARRAISSDFTISVVSFRSPTALPWPHDSLVPLQATPRRYAADRIGAAWRSARRKMATIATGIKLILHADVVFVGLIYVTNVSLKGPVASAGILKGMPNGRVAHLDGKRTEKGGILLFSLPTSRSAPGSQGGFQAQGVSGTFRPTRAPEGRAALSAGAQGR
jgi:hypothetical protein